MSIENRHAWRNRMIGVVLALAVFVIDQAIKIWVDKGLNLYNVRVVEVLPFFDFRWTENYGISLGLLTAGSVEMRFLLIAATGAIALFVAVWMLRERLLADVLPLALVLGGALGNIRDRWDHGFVIDYADLHFGDFRPFLIFNFADAAISIGVLIILARSLLSREKPEQVAQVEPASGELR
ncbi:signal peptidase II [Novosphingobium chloroacetimidivorans]|uniref:Lipoprotein signal peptidase n=1 Tax=Novosphingobium chloroacetimidivorans TaxID=1428314 RepID=A0A7W7K8E8_9SPHN|nr:signal peptidase II [Novosphingobium chloroacetimidivorans]MBB4857821.1 signal peptidase II [Novosphingobium chloroacetimidivorans]